MSSAPAQTNLQCGVLHLRIRGKVASVAGLLALCALPALAQQNVTVPVPAGKSPVWYAWAPKPKVLPSYGPNKPVTRLPEVLAAHKGQASWSADVVQTKRWSA